jgi:hypothetical protein
VKGLVICVPSICAYANDEGSSPATSEMVMGAVNPVNAEQP